MSSDLELGYLLAVSAAAVWTPRPLCSLLAAFESARDVVLYARSEHTGMPEGCEPLGIDAMVRIASIDDEKALETLRSARTDGLSFVTQRDSKYPRRLLDLCDPPPVLYYRGRIASCSERAIAVVGSRAATPYGSSMAREMAADFAQFGVTVVSGLARGIDAAAHKGAISAESATVAVIGSGLEALYPPYHAVLANDIVAHGGAIVSEFPPRMPARAHQFPMRNRIVAALADATVVVEASFKSGALITARLACELGRHVFAIPGDVGRLTSTGTNALIKDGATLATSAADICAVLGWEVIRPIPTSDNLGLPLEEADRVMLALAHGAADPEAISAEARMDIAAVLARLTILEVQGRVERQSGGLFAAVRSSRGANPAPCEDRAHRRR